MMQQLLEHMTDLVEQSKDCQFEGQRMLLINEFVNSIIRYKPDTPADHWQDPIETITSKTGDCEDIAILKFFIAEALDVRGCMLVACKLPANQGNHMVLTWNGVVYDNRVMEAKLTTGSDMIPIYGFDLNHSYLMNDKYGTWKAEAEDFPLKKWQLIKQFMKNTK